MYALFLSCPSATSALQHGGFGSREWLASNGLFRRKNNLEVHVADGNGRHTVQRQTLGHFLTLSNIAFLCCQVVFFSGKERYVIRQLTLHKRLLIFVPLLNLDS